MKPYNHRCVCICYWGKIVQSALIAELVVDGGMSPRIHLERTAMLSFRPQFGSVMPFVVDL